MNDNDAANRATRAAEACMQAMQALLLQQQHQGALMKRLVEERERTSAALDLLVPLMRRALDRLEDLRTLITRDAADRPPP